MFDLDKVLLAASKYNLEAFAQGQQEWTDPGTYNFIVPNYVTSISAVAIGGGGGGSYRNDGGGGGGGALQWRNEIPVTSGETLTVVVGAGGAPSSGAAGSGGASRILRSSTVLLSAEGGAGANGSSGGAGGTAYDAVLYLDGEDGVGQITFRDKSRFPKSISYARSGSNPIISSSRKYGTGSIYFNGNSYIDIPGGNDFVFPGDFTVEGWVYVNTPTATYQTIFELGLYTNGILFRHTNGGASNHFYVNNVNYGNSSVYFPPGSWHHFAITRSSGTVRLFANGVQRFSGVNTGVVNSGGGVLRIGKSTHAGGQYSPPMYIDDFRIVKGIALYTSNFTPPTSALGTTGLGTSSGGVGGNGGSGSERFGGNYLCGGGGGAGGYTGNGGNAGTATGSSRSISYTNGAGGGGAGGRQDDNVGRGGGGTGLHGQKNDGRGDGGGGSSYSIAGIAVNTASANSNKKLYPVALSYAWSNFMNTYAVWTSNYGNTSGSIESVDRVIYAPYSGNYTLNQQADNLIIFKIDGVEINRTSDFRSGSPQSTQFYMTAGRHIITMDVQNYGGGSWGGNPAGFAAVIRNSSSTIIWDTRTYVNGNSSNITSTTRAGGTNADGMNGGDFGGGGSGRDGGSTAGRGGRGGVRIIWGPRRSYPYSAEDVIPFSAPPRGGLILHYDFNNANSYVSGSSVADISGNSNTGSINRSLSSASTFIGANEVFKYMPFPGNFNQKIDFSANELTSSIITVDMWAQISSFAGGMFFGWYIHDVWTNGGTLGYNTGQGDVFGISASRINSLSLVGKWVHYTFVMNAGDYTKNKIYINAVSENLSQQYSRQYTPYTNFNSGNGRIGGWRLENSYQQVMNLAIFRIWNRGLSQEEIVSLYDEDKNRFTVNYQSGLWGRRVSGYYNDNVNYWNGRSVSESRAISQLAGFSSGSDQYSWQFKGYFVAPTSGTYYFRLYSDDASHLWLGSNAVSGYSTSNAFINHGGLHAPSYSGINSIYLDAGSITPMRVMFGENYGQDVLSMLITGPGISGTSYGSGLFFHDESSKSN